MEMSFRKTPTPDLSRVLEESEETKTPHDSNTTLVPDGTEACAEKVGTLIVTSQDVGRRALRPQPSLDPNDPLVRYKSDDISFADAG